MTRLSVSKWQGTGNDFVLLDDGEMRASYDEVARRLCDRRFGVGADGLIVMLAPRAPGADLAIRIFNADGTEAETCGNGLRCVALARTNGARGALAIETTSGMVRAEVLDGASVRVDMGEPSFARRDIPMTGPPLARAIGVPVEIAGEPVYVCGVSLGNPHCVVFAHDGAGNGARAPDPQALAAALNDASLFPRGVNVEVVTVCDRHGLAMRVWERGVGETWACGSGACAAAVAAIETGRSGSPLRVAMRGGSVAVEWRGAGSHAFLTGPAAQTFRAEIEFDEIFSGSTEGR